MTFSRVNRTDKGQFVHVPPEKRTVKGKAHTVRGYGGGEPVEMQGLTRARAIKLHCTECMGWECHPKECTSPLCALYPYRGKMFAREKQEMDQEMDNGGNSTG
jgi:hypothetical protein